MPIPLTTFFRNESLMKNRACKTILRGNLLYDYADPTITWTYSGGTFLSESIPQNEPWTYFIPRTMTLASTDTITRSSNFGSSKTFTLMFRVFMASLSNPPPGNSTSLVFSGTPPTSFYGIAFDGANSTLLTFKLIWTSGGSIQPALTLSSTPIVSNKWYHIALKVVDNGTNNDIYGYVNGIMTLSSPSSNYVNVGSGSTTIGKLAFTQVQGFKITEVVFLQKALSNEEIAGYSSSPYL